MNQRNNNEGVGRLTGRSVVDAGLMRYRELLSRRNHPVAGRGVVRVLAMVGLLVLVLSMAGAAQMSVGCLFLTPGTGAGGVAMAGIERAPGVSILASSGAFELTAAGWSFAYWVARYNGELCCGPYCFAP